MIMKHHIKTLKTACALSVYILTGALGEAQAADHEAQFNIPAQSLETALLSFSEQADLVVTASPDLVAGQQAPALNGMMAREKALKMLLSSSGLDVQVNPGGSITIVRRVRQPAETSLVDTKEDVSFVLEEIIVTATRREASMMDIPMSIVAFSGQRVEESGIHDVLDMQFLAAGLQVNNQDGIVRISVRGIGSDQVTSGGESGVAMHRDGVYIAQRGEIGFGFFDVERIEVLRGPQGTLYGRNATGGAVNVISKSPTQEFEAGGTFSVGNYGFTETKGYVSGPVVGDTVTARLAFKTWDHDGYTANIFDGNALDNGDFSAVRGIVRYEPSENMLLDVSADYNRDHGVPIRINVHGRSDAPLPFEVAGHTLPTGRAVNINDPSVNDREAWGLAAKLRWDFNNLSLSALSSYRELSWYSVVDGEGGATSLVNLGADTLAKQFSQELILSSNYDGNLDWLVGAYYFGGRQKAVGFLDVVPFSRTSGSFEDFKTRAYAVFSEANYKLLESLTLTFGARYSYETKRMNGGSGEVVTFEDDDNWGAFTPKVALTYSASDSLTAYLTVGKGFKSGGYNGSTANGNFLGAFDEEQVINYEAGLKSIFLDGRVRTNIVLFYMDYSDLQVTVRRPDPETTLVASVIQNAAKADIQGVEFDFQAQVTDQFSMDGNASWLDSTYDQWPDAIDGIRGSAEFDVSGNKVQNSPEWALNIGADYTWLVGDWGTAKLRGEYAYKSRVFFTPFEDNDLSQKGFNLLNARLSFEDADGRWTFAAWAKNITNEEASALKIELFSGLTGNRLSKMLIPPRTYGVTLGYHF